MRWAVVFIVAAACSSEDHAKPAASAPARYETAATPLPVSELRGLRMCEDLLPLAEVSRIAATGDVGIPAGKPKAGDGRLRCLYQWPKSGPASGSVELRVDCRELRPEIGDLTTHWKTEAIEQIDGGLVRKPAAGVVQVHLGLRQPPCYMSVTVGSMDGAAALALAEAARSRLGPHIELALADYPASASARDSQ